MSISPARRQPCRPAGDFASTAAVFPVVASRAALRRRRLGLGELDVELDIGQLAPLLQIIIEFHIERHGDILTLRSAAQRDSDS